MQQSNSYTIPCRTLEEFYKNWLDIMTPIHQLTSKNKQILLAFIMLRYELIQKGIEESKLDEELMSDESKTLIKERCNLQGNYLQVAMFTLAKHNVLIKSPSKHKKRTYNYKINPKVLPQINYTDKLIPLQFNFKLLCSMSTTPDTTKQ